ncbi:sulfatase-like hydrolase/transferase [Pendulispora albinea]|uniref:Sulfatase-like hydrolase/transferase n=1 Tax=Pendulispora albinea TaxID=2741071 RepID=A0ABZ2LQ91_9BACT
MSASLGGALAACAGTPPPAATSATTLRKSDSGSKPNLLVIIVDQMRAPVWFRPGTLEARAPRMHQLFSRSVRFMSHYTAASMCTPSRASMLTGLYAHQHRLLLTRSIVTNPPQPELRPELPTWGTALRHFGYDTWWFGKWHESNVPEHCPADASGDAGVLEAYGFKGTTCPDIIGSNGEGLSADGSITDQFVAWLRRRAGQAGQGTQVGPWATTISLINPHDIMYYPKETDTIASFRSPPVGEVDLPPNFETLAHLEANKPRLHAVYARNANKAFGDLPHEGEAGSLAWRRLLALYLELHGTVDPQIGAVLDALASSPFAKNTMVVFTADHGEYGGSHGLRGKGAAAYEEGIRIPLAVHDPTGRLANGVETPRTELTSSVDLLPMLLTLAHDGKTSWRSQYPYLAERLDLIPLLKSASAPGREQVLHTTDEKFLTTPGIVNHVVALRTKQAKIGHYSLWNAGTVEPAAAQAELELYDYGTREGQLETVSVAASNTGLRDQMSARLASQGWKELRAPLPEALREAQHRAISDYVGFLARPPAPAPVDTKSHG